MRKFNFTVVFASIFVSIFAQIPTFAIDARTFNPGRIIDDSVFTNSDSMTAEQIQKFLESKVSCDTNGVKRSELGGGTRAQFLASRNLPSSNIRCITDYVENPTTNENNYGKNSGEIKGGLRASEIIYNYSKQFGINPQVILATLQKENSMITDEWPLLKQFQEAMGFGCPDNIAPGAPACDPSYKSFASQIYQAARHFRGYMDAKPGWYVSFRNDWNNVGFHPNAACGSSRVYIENRATVALYTYTPYQPNQAALNAQYGVGDACSSYGNRNFYLYFNDWFGSVNASQIVRTKDDGRLFLLAGKNKYYIPSMEILENLKSISSEIGYVSQGFLDEYKDSGALGKMIRDENSGGIYLLDSGKKFHFTSCETVADFGFSCENIPNLTSSQIEKIPLGGAMTNFAKIGSRNFYVKNATKMEILDEKSLAENRISTSKFNNLSASSIYGLKLEKPIIRSDVLIQDSSNGALFYVNQLGDAHYVGGEIFALPQIKKLEIKPLNSESVNLLSKKGNFSNLVKNSNEMFVLSGKSKIKIEFDENSVATEISKKLLDDFPTEEMIGSTIMFDDSGVVYFARGKNLHPIYDWGTVLSVNPSGKILKVSASAKKFFNIENKGFISAGRLVKARNQASIYLIDGILGSKKYLSSFDIAKSLGLKDQILELSSEALEKYPNNGFVSSLVNCSGDLFVASAGKLKYVSAEKMQQYGFVGEKFVRYLPETCAKFTKSGNLTDFALSKDGPIYKIENGTKRHVRSFEKFKALGGNDSNLLPLDNQVLNSIKTGEVY